MIDSETIKILRGELIGNNPRHDIIEQIVKKYDEKEFELPDVALNDNVDYRTREIALATIHTVYRMHFEHLEKIKAKCSLSLDDIEMLVALTVDMANARNEHERAFKIIEHMPLDNMRTGKCVVSYINDLLRAEKYEEASNIWRRYKDIGIPEKSMFDVLKKEFKKAMTFGENTDKHDYSKAYKLQKLFNLPKDITFNTVSEEFKLNNKKGNYLDAATLGYNFKLNPSATNEAAFLAWESEINRFIKNLENNYYREFNGLEKNDSYAKAKDIRYSFHIFDYNNEYSNKDNNIIRKIQEIAHKVFDELLTPKILQGNSKSALIYFANSLIHDYQLVNDTLSVNITERTQSRIKDVIKLIEDEIKDSASVELYMPVLEDLKEISRLDIREFDAMGKKLLFVALDEKDIKHAKKVFDAYYLDLSMVAPQLVNYANKWAEHNLFDLISEFLSHFDIKKILSQKTKFMEHVNDYYDYNMKSNKYLTCLITAEQFDMKHKKHIEPLKLLIREYLKKQDLSAISAIIKKYKVRHKDIVGSVKLIYVDFLATDRNFAKHLRKFFNLSAFDVGFLNWLLYELLGFKIKIPELAEE